MVILEFILEFLIQIVWEGVLRFVGACVRFIFSKDNFQESLRNDSSPLIGLGCLFLFIAVFFWFK